jgi:hypothetical protein
VIAVRNLTFLCAFFALALPSVASAHANAPGDGTMLIRDAIGKVTIVAKGGVIGHFGEGTLTVRDPNPDDNINEVVTGAERTRPVNDYVTKYIGGKFTVTLVGSDIDLSAIGRGTVTIVGKGTADDGTYSVNGFAPQPFPGPFFPMILQLSAASTG